MPPSIGGSSSGLTPSAVHFPVPCLMLVTDRWLCGGVDPLVDMVDAALPGGVNAVQLREKDLSRAGMIALARRLREVTLGRALLIVNGPLNVALACDADGIHLPEAAGPIQRPHPSLLVGRSVHSAGAAVRAEAEAVDYLIAGPVYETASHPGATPAGASLVSGIAACARVPVIAIGGISAGRVDEVIRAGASGVAVISAILASSAPIEAVRDLRRALDVAYAAVKPVLS